MQLRSSRLCAVAPQLQDLLLACVRTLEFDEGIRSETSYAVGSWSRADGCELLCAGVQQIEVYDGVELGLGAEAGGYEVWAETRVCAEGMEE